MRKKFTYLISLVAALICSSSGVAWGQDTWWDGQACHDTVHTASECSIVQIDGNASMTYYKWSDNPLAVHTWSSNANCGYDEVEHQSWLTCSLSGEWNLVTRERSRDCYVGDWDNNSSTPDDCGCTDYGPWSTESSSPLTTWGYNTISTSWYEWYYGSGIHDHGHAPHGHTDFSSFGQIAINLPSIVTSLDFMSPTWTHHFYEYTLNWSDGTPSVSTVGAPTYPDVSGDEPIGIMRPIGSDLRFTGGDKQIEKVGITLTTTTLYLPNRVFFDQSWNGSYNGVAMGAWNPVTAGVTAGKVFGSGGGYTGSSIDVKGGVLLLGPASGSNSDCLTQNFAINTTTAEVIVDSYDNDTEYTGGVNSNDYTPKGCVTLNQSDISYPTNTITTTIGGNKLHITNSDYGCFDVHFCGDLFQPTFSGTGELLIDPSKTRFMAGTTLSPSTNEVNITSNLVEVKGNDFTYTPTNTAKLNILLHTDWGGCADCAYLKVLDNKNFILTNKGGEINIKDNQSNGNSGNVEVTGDYEGTADAAGGYQKVNIGGHILVNGHTKLNDAKDNNMTFISQHSWMKFGNNPLTAQYFDFKGTGKLYMYAQGDCGISTCGSNGGYITFSGPVVTNNLGGTGVEIKTATDYILMDSGFYHTGDNQNLLVKAEGHSYIKINSNYNGTPTALSTAPALVGVDIERSGAGNDSFESGGHIEVTNPFTFNGSGTGKLFVNATGACDLKDDCDNYVRGYVLFGDAVTVGQSSSGVTEIKSNLHYVEMQNGYAYSGSTINSTGDMTVSGHSYVDIKNSYPVVASTSPDIVIPSSSSKREGVYIKRVGDASDNILSDAGHIHVTSPFTYDQTVATSTKGLTVWANGACDADICGEVNGYVAIDSTVITKNGADNGFVKIQSSQHYVKLGHGIVHEGQKGNLDIWGNKRVDIENAYHGGVAATVSSPAITLTATTGPSGLSGYDSVGVYINRTDEGIDSIWSEAGHVMVERPFLYNQTAGTTTNGLLIYGQGACDAVECNNSDTVGGYVWLKSDANILNSSKGTTTIKSDFNYVRIGGETPLVANHNGQYGGHLLYKGKDGDLNVLASKDDNYDDDCYNACDGADYKKPDKLLINLDFHDTRGYVWINDDVNITMSGTAGTEGNAVIRSYHDIVQMDDYVTYTDATGANLWVEGLWGVRTLGPTDLTNVAYSNTGDGTSSPDAPLYPTAGQGFVTYYSPNGYVDFGVAPNIGNDNPDVLGGNTPFKYTATVPENALLIEGNSRVFFGDSVTIAMGPVGTNGDAKIYSPKGWIKFADTVGYTGTAGNLNIYADGKQDTSMRSCMNDGLTCDPRGGFVLFDSITNIEVSDKGVTWIRSNHDDVVMGDMFTYTNTTPADPNGEFIMQAGQDIYGRNVYNDGHHGQESDFVNNMDYSDTILFDQQGNKSVLLEAKKTIHIQQMLLFKRNNAKAGDITLKAGYPTFSEPSSPISGQAASAHEATPSADLANLDWTAEPIANCIPNDYASRFSCTDPRNPGFTGSRDGGDIWFEDSVMFDLSGSADKKMPVTLRAMNSIFIDSTLVYNHKKSDPAVNANNVLLFAETGNVEAAVTRQNAYGDNKLDNPGYIADDSVVFNMDPTYVSELRIQAGNQPTDINAAPTHFAVNNCWWKLGCTGGAEFDGNILFNKPLLIHNAGKDASSTLLSAARDIETQVMAPFTFDYSDATNPTHGDLLLTAGRHIETHAMMKFDYPNTTDDANITMQAGRLKKATMTGNDALCKANEAGTTLTDKDDATKAFDPDVETGGVYDSKNNEFAESGTGNGSILMFDSVEFNYEGSGKILMTALNGNIESDPYLHRVPNEPANPGLTIAGNAGAGYMPYLGYPRSTPSNPLQHDAQLTFNHKGTGITRLEAIDIKLHDKIAYYDRVGTLTTTLFAGFGKLEINSYDSILTRNLEYVNHNGDQNLEITSDKYKLTDTDCSGQTCPDNECYMDGNGAIQQGHIVLGYGADWITTDDDRKNMNDSIVINFAGNQFTAGANALIKAGYKGFSSNKVKGTTNSNLFVAGLDKGKAYGGNITFDYMKVDMAKGNHTSGGYMEISTPNGNIWGKDSINYRGINGDLLVDAGLGSIEDLDAIRWNTGGTEAVGGVNNNGHYVAFENSSSCINGKENTLNTNVPGTCDSSMWRTGNIMMKGGSLNFNDSVNGNVAGTGNATFRTREGFIDTYDAFTVDSMQGDLLKYAGTMNSTSAATNEWGDISERDFEYHQVENSGSIFYGADDNIMMNYGYSNGDTKGGEAYEGRGEFDLATGKLADTENPFYSTTYKPSIDAGRSIYNVNRNGYLWYRTEPAKIWMNGLHKLYRGCTARTTAQTGVCSPITGECMTIGNYARDLMFNFDTTAVDGKTIMTGGLGMVATNFIDMFTKFTYFGGQGSGMGSVPGMSSLHGESVSGYGLYLKSQFDGQKVEKRRATCQDCDKKVSFPMEDKSTEATYEWTYIGFHDDARIYTQDQKGLIEAPVIEFFGHAELNPYMAASGKGDPGEGNLTLKGDSLIFHDSAIFDGTNLILTPYTTGEQRQNDMRYGVINDVGKTSNYYKNYGPAIQMPDRNTPILEFGYQRCNEPPKAPQKAPNARSKAGLEATPMVGGDVIISFQHNFSLPIYNTIVANNARISFISDSLDAPGGEYVDTYIRTDLLRIRNKVEFYTGQNEFGKDGNNPKNRSGKFRLSSTEYQEAMDQGTGIFPRHLHMEPGSELSIPGEDTMKIHSMTTAGGYGIIHENISVVANGTIAPGYASLMECDCQSPHRQGQLTVHNLTMEKDAIFRISIGNNNPCYDEDGNIVSNHCTATDTLTVLDSIWFNGKIPVHILPETEELDPGCYLFLDYGDSLGVTPEYVKNFTLPIDRFQDHYFGFDYSTPGKVYLCVMEFPQPIVQRYVKLPAVEGVTTTPNAGTHYVSGHQDFSFTAKYSGTPLKVTATGYYHGGPIDLDQTATILPDGSYQYTIFQVVQPYDVEFGPEISSVQVGNDYIGAPLVYAYKNTLHINVDKEDIVSIYNMTGVLYKKIEVPAGNSKFTLDRGMYVVTLKDGSVYKIVIK